jgi:hypothetical protein
MRPPGFWRDPDATRRLGAACTAVAAAAGTLFCALAGLATWMLRAPDPLGLGAFAWGALLLAFALALVPLWWRALQEA